MGDIETTHVDVGALFDVAGRYDALADLVDGVVQVLATRLSFDGALAGRDYTARGGALRRAVDDVVAQMRGWSRASREIAAALRISGARYVDADARGAVRLG